MERNRRASRSNARRPKVWVAMAVAFVMAAAPLGVAYADLHLEGKMDAWAQRQVDTAVSALSETVMSETEIQKQYLQQQLHAMLDQKSNELAAYTEEQQRLAVEALQAHANGLIAHASFANDNDKAAYSQQLSAILANAMAAMDQVGHSPASIQPEEEALELLPQGQQPTVELEEDEAIEEDTETEELQQAEDQPTESQGVEEQLELEAELHLDEHK
ncbi:hypothetical protein [Paenibacillus sp. PL2-23]|uniref:hypothetical protein n=1 Tax=Paenibacillus sp. PL2-23 TaxID=2100729 RepID=UPI0030F97664